MQSTFNVKISNRLLLYWLLAKCHKKRFYEEFLKI